MNNLEPIYTHSDHTNCYTYFQITGDFNPDTVFEMLGLIPEESWKIGDMKKDGNSKYDFAYWKFGTCKEYDVIVENQMLTTITPLLSKISILSKIKEKYDVDFTLEVVPTVRFDKTAPCLAPSMKIMQFCCDSGTEIDIDLYVSYPDDFENGILHI